VHGNSSIKFQSSDRKIWVQSREDLNFPVLADYGDNRYGLRFTRGRHGVGEWIHSLISEDRGQTWRDDHTRDDPTYHGFFITRLRDGSLFGITPDPDKTTGLFLRQVVSYDSGRSWSCSREPVEGVEAYGSRARDIYSWNAPLELPNGCLLLGTYFFSRFDESGFKSEVEVLERKPGETIWRRKSNVFGLQLETQEGANEAALALLPSGRIVCAARTGYPDSPMLWAYSDDEGASWSEPTPLPWSGVAPRMYLMGNGALVLIFGARRADKLNGALTAVGSLDGGEGWSEPFVLYDGPGSCYHTGIVTGPDQLLISYAESQFRRLELPQFTPPGEYNKICAIALRVSC